MLYRGPMGGGAASGRVGALVASHNSGGQYMRARTTPTNPRTDQQQGVRNALSTLSNRFATVLTDPQREGWKTQGLLGSFRNRLGDSITLSAIAAYLRANAARLQAGDGPVDDAPPVFVDTPLTLPVATLTAPSTISLAFDNTDDWAGQADGHLYIYASRPQNPAVNFFNGPYRLLGAVDGITPTPPTSPASFSYDPVLFGALTAGQVVFFRYRAVSEVGQLSAALVQRTVAL